MLDPSCHRHRSTCFPRRERRHLFTIPHNVLYPCRGEGRPIAEGHDRRIVRLTDWNHWLVLRWTRRTRARSHSRKDCRRAHESQDVSHLLCSVTALQEKQPGRTMKKMRPKGYHPFKAHPQGWNHRGSGSVWPEGGNGHFLRRHSAEATYWRRLVSLLKVRNCCAHVPSSMLASRRINPDEGPKSSQSLLGRVDRNGHERADRQPMQFQLKELRLPLFAVRRLGRTAGAKSHGR